MRGALLACVALVGAGPLNPYLVLVRSYARGERALALAGLEGFSEKQQVRQFELIKSLAVQAERCPSCPEAGAFKELPLKAAVMLHADRDEVERPRSEEVEQPRPCPGRQAWLAGRYATLLARWPATREFARGFFLAMALRCQVDACLAPAQAWGEEAVQLFPRDSMLLFGLGSVHEETAALITDASVIGTSRAARRDEFRLGAVERERHLKQARRFFGEAVAADGGFALARVRLARVLWRLGDAEGAQAALEAALPRTVDPATLYLARLFLGRVHEDAGRLDEAQAEYRLALQLDPEAQAAALSLSHVLRLAGQPERSRQVLAQAVAPAGKRVRRDLYWDYLLSHVAAHPDKLFEELRRESLQ